MVGMPGSLSENACLSHSRDYDVLSAYLAAEWRQLVESGPSVLQAGPQDRPNGYPRCINVLHRRSPRFPGVLRLMRNPKVLHHE
jgi:hypothetical protein